MSTFSPPTPPSRAPTYDEQRFKTITSPCEWVEDYHPGGYHPVHIGDVFKNGQYKVIRKLGEGSYSTVWLASDLRYNQYIALKILVSEISRFTADLRILRHIAEVALREASQHVTRLLGDFEHLGPNGIHKVLVLEPMGASVNNMVEELPQFKPRRQEMIVAIRLIWQRSLQALEFLHDNGVSHGDFQPGNLLFTLDDIESKPKDVLRQAEDVQARSISPPVERLDGKQDKWAPRYLCIAQPLEQFTHYTEGFNIKLSDMGGDPPSNPVIPVGLRAPELILTGGVDRTLDVSNFGCLVFELITGQPLFCVPGSNFEDDDHLLLLTARIGALPEELFLHWKSSSLYFTADRKRFNCQLGSVGDGEEPLTTIEELFDQAGLDLTEEDACNYDPTKRPSPAELLLDPWFREIDI
ncbi:serine/threonine-protein kinase SSN3 [Colletotrichum spaethianum]|uniref:non-specific serine/threonine protein kinase n=1 Tax=Colletotrichum spaethianum TaxID=700344 RepID=A0AA37UPJ7_9PEZI|nr:serine/threonine-protein kinase SSN3 [Colletotrichum spaethianum]GKT50820.1 serine/threonine-protein kinase SSN3 [Colletotrichum spaethianum]